MKKCKICGIEKPLTDFTKQSNGERRIKCKKCIKETENPKRYNTDDYFNLFIGKDGWYEVYFS